jgi:hypothetical protein
MAWQRPYWSAVDLYMYMVNVHQVLTGDLGDFTVLEELSVVVECHEDTGGGPRELVTKSVVGGLHVSRDQVY